MIKFFRKIRQNLLYERKTGKYLKYAIGEIVLVVIGILIALQINNWNENLKKNDTIKVLTENLHTEFKKNLEELEIDIIRLRRKITAGKVLLSYCGIQHTEISEFKVDSLLFETFETPTWNPSTFTLNEIKNSGKLSDTENIKLKLLLYQWERLYEDILEWQNSLTQSIQGPLDILKRKGSIVNMDFYNGGKLSKSKFNISNKNLLQEIQFENELENNLFNARALDKKYKKAKILLTEIIELSKNDITF